MNESIQTKQLLELILGHQLEESKSISIDEAIQTFLFHVQNELSEGTYKFYKIEFNCLKKYFKLLNITNTNQIDNNLILQLINIKKSEGVSNNTINKLIGTLKAMLNYLKKINLISENKVTIEKLKFKEAKIVIPSKQELLLIKKHFDNNESLEFRLIFYLIIDTGLRRSSIASLKISDIDLNKQKIIPSHTKEHNEIIVYFGNNTKQLIIDYIELRKNKKSKWLFPNIRKPQEHISPEHITKTFCLIANKIGIRSLSPHRLRHYFGTNLIRENVNPEIVRKLLGHSTMYMTQKYINLEENDLKEASLNNSIADKINE